jgi:putative restriction endonuclease
MANAGGGNGLPRSERESPNRRAGQQPFHLTLAAPCLRFRLVVVALRGNGMGDLDIDHRVRLAAFQFLDEQALLHGESLPWKALHDGFLWEGQRVPLLGPQGIFKPAVLPDMPLSIATAPPKDGVEPPYDDRFESGELLAYHYRGEDPRHRDNVGLRLAMKRHAPLVYLYGLVKGRYMAFWPVYVVGEDEAACCFKVEVDDRKLALKTELADRVSEEDEGRRQYATVLAKRRIHQEAFRLRVLRAYRESCAICRLRHAELLEAAHILPDGHPKGKPVVPNGIALCALHHAAFDRHFLGIRPDCVVQLRKDILDEADGPMLQYGLQGFHGARLIVPRPQDLKPNPEFLAERFAQFEKAG